LAGIPDDAGARQWIKGTTQIKTLDIHPKTKCIKRIPFNFCPSSATAHAASPVATTGTVEIAASNKLKYAAAANVRFFVRCAR
jgi:hypothetical protein